MLNLLNLLNLFQCKTTASENSVKCVADSHKLSRQTIFLQNTVKTRTATGNENLFELQRHSSNRYCFKRVSQLKKHQKVFELTTVAWWQGAGGNAPRGGTLKGVPKSESICVLWLLVLAPVPSLFLYFSAYFLKIFAFAFASLSRSTINLVRFYNVHPKTKFSSCRWQPWCRLLIVHISCFLSLNASALFAFAM